MPPPSCAHRCLSLRTPATRTNTNPTSPNEKVWASDQICAGGEGYARRSPGLIGADQWGVSHVALRRVGSCADHCDRAFLVATVLNRSSTGLKSSEIALRRPRWDDVVAVGAGVPAA